MRTPAAVLSLFLLVGSNLFAAPEDLSTTPVQQDAKWAVKWWMPRHEEKLAAAKSQEKIDLLFIGDSITHGWENAGKATWAKYYAPRNAFNIGFSGDRTEHVLWRLQNGAVDNMKPKVAVIMIGTNNVGHRKEASELTAKGVKAILDELKVRLPETKILLLAIFPRGPAKDHPMRKINDATNEMLAAFADGKRVTFLSINDTFLDDDGNLPKEIMPDRLHPKQEGYRLWAEAMEPTLKKLLGE